MLDYNFKGKLKFFILAALQKKPLHGYLLMKTISENCLNFWHPTPGALYPALEELKKEKLISVKHESKTGRRKKVYLITAAGKNSLKDFSENLKEMQENFLKIARNPELSKYEMEDAVYLFKLMHNLLSKELSRYEGTLLEFSMLARTGKLSEKQRNNARKAFKEFLERIREINQNAE
jgi:DNA-binding PadR family transcriptional regulator